MPTVTTATDGPVLVVTIDRPERRNAVDRPTAAALAETFRTFDADDTLSVAVLTGAGGTFCAGADLKAIAGRSGARPGGGGASGDGGAAGGSAGAGGRSGAGVSHEVAGRSGARPGGGGASGDGGAAGGSAGAGGRSGAGVSHEVAGRSGARPGGGGASGDGGAAGGSAGAGGRSGAGVSHEVAGRSGARPGGGGASGDGGAAGGSAGAGGRSGAGVSHELAERSGARPGGGGASGDGGAAGGSAGAGGRSGAGVSHEVAGGEGNRVTVDGDGPMGPTRMVLSKPVIAAIEGFAVAGGIELALWCDLRVAATDATLGVYCRRFGVPLVDLGSVRLPRLIGHSRALDLILTGRGVGGEEALTMGLVNRLAAPGQALAEAVALAHQLAAFPQTCLRNDLRSAREQWDLTYEAALRNEVELGLATIATGETQAGAARFTAGEGRGGPLTRQALPPAGTVGSSPTLARSSSRPAPSGLVSGRKVSTTSARPSATRQLPSPTTVLALLSSGPSSGPAASGP